MTMVNSGSKGLRDMSKFDKTPECIILNNTITSPICVQSFYNLGKILIGSSTTHVCVVFGRHRVVFRVLEVVFGILYGFRYLGLP